MPSKEDYLQQAESYKDQGNTHFSRQQYHDAIPCYSQGIVAIDRIPEMTMMTDSSPSSSLSFYSTVSVLKWTLLSNRALARIKRYETSRSVKKEKEEEEDILKILLKDAIEDCQTAITSMTSNSSSGSNSTSDTSTTVLRAKLLYRSAKADRKSVV